VIFKGGVGYEYRRALKRWKKVKWGDKDQTEKTRIFVGWQGVVDKLKKRKVTLCTCPRKVGVPGAAGSGQRPLATRRQGGQKRSKKKKTILG